MTLGRLQIPESLRTHVRVAGAEAWLRELPALVANVERAFRLRGSAAEVVDVGPLNHELTAFAAFPLIRTWFDELAAGT